MLLIACFAILLRKNIKIINIVVIRIFHIYVLLIYVLVIYVLVIYVLVIYVLVIYMLVIYVFPAWLYLILTKRSGDIEQNPRPKSNSCQSFSICHWNLNSISAHNFIKIFLLKLTLPLTNWMLYAYQKLILTPVFQMMMTIWKFLVMIYSEQTTHLILNEAVFVFIIETLFP